MSGSQERMATCCRKSSFYALYTSYSALDFPGALQQLDDKCVKIPEYLKHTASNCMSGAFVDCFDALRPALLQLCSLLRLLSSSSNPCPKGKVSAPIKVKISNSHSGRYRHSVFGVLDSPRRLKSEMVESRPPGAQSICGGSAGNSAGVWQRCLNAALLEA